MGKLVAIATALLESCKAIEENTTPEQQAGWSEFPDIQLAPPAMLAKMGAQGALRELHVALQTPTEAITTPAMQMTTLIAFQAMYRFGIAEKVPVEGTTSYAEVAKACGLPESDLRRIVRYLITWNIFTEPQPNQIAHNGASKAFKENKYLQSFLGLCTEEIWPAAAHHVDAMSKNPGSQEPNQPGWALFNSTDLGLFENIADKPERANRFADAMTFMGGLPGLGMEPVVLAYKWDELGEATVVDVGGSYGEFAKRLLPKYPKLNFVVQDLGSTVEGARKLPQVDRLSFMEHNFLEKQPLEAQVYMFRWIFHDWPDKYCIRILQSLIPALKPGARILIMDFCLPEPGQAPRLVEEGERSFDLAMWCLFNAKERSAEEWGVLVKQADARFKLNNIVTVPDSLLCVMEVMWE